MLDGHYVPATQSVVAIALATAIGLTAFAESAALASPSYADHVGINISNSYYNGKSTVAPNTVLALSRSGASWVRVNLLWGWTVEAHKDEFKWTGLDEGIAALRAAHLNILMTLNVPVPCWALPNATSSAPGSCTKPQETIPDSTAWRNFVTAAVKRYGNEVNYWEIWNEPDLPTAISGEGITDANRLALYRDRILIPAAQAIHAANPSDKVVAPALSINYRRTAPEENLTAALETSLGNGAARYVDVVSVHIYAPFDLVSYGYAARAAMRKVGLGNAPLWLTETGIQEPSDSTGAMSEPAALEQQRYLVGDFARALRSGIFDKLFWFALYDSSDFAGSHTDGFGLVDNRDYVTFPWSPRPAYRALQSLLGARPERGIASPGPK